MEKETLNILISKIKEIDKALDDYEYMGWTYEAFIRDKNDNKRGNMSLRNRTLHEKHIWNDWMEDTIKNLKDTCNELWKGNYIGKYEIEREIKMLGKTRDVFIKNTDNLSLYPMQSEIIRDNINFIINILRKI